MRRRARADSGRAARHDRALLLRRVNPLDHFTVDGEGLHFSDLAVDGDLADDDTEPLRWSRLDADGDRISPAATISETYVPHGELATGAFHGVQSKRTRRRRLESKPASSSTDDGRAQLVRVDRET